MSSKIWRRCSMEGSMIWERCRREAPATGLGRSLFTPLPRHVSVFDCEARSVIYSWKVESGKWRVVGRAKLTSPRRNSYHTNTSQLSFPADEASCELGAGGTIGDILKQRAALRGYRRAEILLKGVFFPRRGILRVSWRGKKCSGGGGARVEGRNSGGKRRGEQAAVGGGGTAKGAAGARWGRGGEGEMHLSGRGSRPEQPRNLFFFSTTSTTSRQYILHRPPCIVSQCMQLYLCIRLLCAAMF